MGEARESRSIAGGAGDDLDVRLLRYFVAVADELHFTRAAARLFVAEQALSRDVRRLERILGVRLFVRTTRQVALTAEGERFLPRAREIVALHDRALREVRRDDRPVVVDVIGELLTGAQVVAAARSRHPELELVVRHGGGFAAALARVLAGELDAAFGRVHGLERGVPPDLVSHLIRFEPLGLFVPEQHPLAGLDEIPLVRLRGMSIDIGEGSAEAREWVDLGRQLAARSGAAPLGPHLMAEGVEETAHHLARERVPILTHLDHPPIPGAACRPLVDPVPLYAWSLVHRKDVRSPAITALLDAARRLARTRRWLDVPDGAWLPEPEASEWIRAATDELPGIPSLHITNRPHRQRRGE